MTPRNLISNQQLDDLKFEFEKNFERRGELGASVVVMQNGETLLSLAKGQKSQGGEVWGKQTLVPIYSATKAVAATTVLTEIHLNGLSPHDKVQSIWPNFPEPDATFAQLLSHQCGFVSLDQQASIQDYDSVIDAIENQTPHWPLGSAHGYHPRVFGYLVDEVVRRLTGKRLGQVWNDGLRKTMGDLDLWIGLPEAHYDRVAQLYPGKMGKKDPLETEFYQAFGTKGTLTQGAFTSPRGLNSVSEMNQSTTWSLALPAMGGIATAQALAQFYQELLGQCHGVIAPEVRSWLAQPQVSGNDLVLMRETSFGMGVMLDPRDESGRKTRHLFGHSTEAFGHPGAGGAHAFCDAKSGVSFAYTMNQMELSVMPSEKSLSMVKALGI